MQWYYASNGQRLGPVSQDEFQKLVTDGVVKADTLVWQQGMTDWKPYATVGGGGAAASPTAPGAGSGADDGSEICVVSGKRFPRREMINFEGKWISAEHRDEFFQRQREGVAQPGQFVYGNFWPRFRAKFIDGIIVWVATVVVNTMIALVLLSSSGLSEAFTAAAGVRPASGAFTLVSNVVSIALGVGYSWFFLSRYSATPGKMVVGLKVVRPDGSPLSTGRIIGRHFAEWLSGMILLIGYIMAASDEERRALHDRICDTRVIKLEMTTGPALPCPSCKRVLEAHSWRDEAGGSCGRCQVDFDFIGFPALRAVRTRVAAQSTSVVDDSVCFFHGENRAEVVCDDCGRLLCGVCTLNFAGRKVCPSCLSAAKKSDAEPAVKSRMIYDRVALLLAVAPMIVWPLTIISAPVTVGFVIHGWKKPCSLVLGRSKGRFIVAGVLAALQIGGWITLGILLWLKP